MEKINAKLARVDKTIWGISEHRLDASPTLAASNSGSSCSGLRLLVSSHQHVRPSLCFEIRPDVLSYSLLVSQPLELARSSYVFQRDTQGELITRSGMSSQFLSECVTLSCSRCRIYFPSLVSGHVTLFCSHSRIYFFHRGPVIKPLPGL